MARLNTLTVPKPPDSPIPPTPTSDEGSEVNGLGLGDSVYITNPNSLSPYMASNENLPLITAEQHAQDDGDEGQGPFNFKPQLMDLAKSPVSRSSVGQRRGHKYKHSSISANIILEPVHKAPLSIPASLPVPTLSECWSSMNKSQMVRLYWCLMHVSVAAMVLWTSSGSLAQTALSHLILYDAFGAMLVVTVDVLGNFDVWRRSSVRHPFGLQRAEVLAGFAMSVLLLFMGFDLVSHTAQHMLEEVGDHEAHVEHEHERVSAAEVDLAAISAIAATLTSALVLQNHGRIGKVLRLGYFEHLPGVLSNPSHFLTIVCSALLILLPLLGSEQMYTVLDRAVSGSVALAMCALGMRLVYELGMMLLMSYNGASNTGDSSSNMSKKNKSAVADVLAAIEADAAVARVDEARFWQVHYGLNMANVRLALKRGAGVEESIAKVRERVQSLVRNRLGGGYGSGSARWEVSTQVVVEG